MSVLSLETLKELTGYSKPVDIKLCLQRQGIKFAEGKRGVIWTTTTAVEAAIGVNKGSSPDTEPEFTLADMT